MSRILKWNIPVDDQCYRIGRGEIVHVDTQFLRLEEIQVWTHEEVDRLPGVAVGRVVQVYGTGHPLLDGAVPLGTAILARGDIVWHLVELPYSVYGGVARSLIT